MGTQNSFVCLELIAIGQRFGCLRTMTDRGLEAMKQSLRKYGQLSPVVVVETKTGFEMVDGFKRLRSAQDLAEISTLQCKILTQASPQAAKIAMYRLNQVSSSRLNALEEGWIVQSLHRAEKMNQVQIAQALGRHKTWVCRRLQLVERLSTRAQEDIRAGLLSPTAARELVKLPRGNQKQLLDTVVQEGLSSRELAQVAALYQSAKSPAQKKAILTNPRGALKAKRRSKDAVEEGLSTEGLRILNNIRLLERVGNALAGYLETEYPKATKDQATLNPWLRRLDRTLKLLSARLQRSVSPSC
jgi:ParB/RepB/Spo0J family partition protein